MKPVTSSLVCIATAAALVGAGAVNAAVITNGSFEQCSPNCPTDATALAAGSGQLTGWTVGSANGGNASQAVQWVPNAAAGGWNPASGSYSIALSGQNDGSVSQTIATQVGATYDISFQVSGSPVTNPISKTVGVGVGSAPIQYDTFTDTSTSNTNMVWTTETYQFTATSTSSILTLFNDNTNTITQPNKKFYGMGLDNVTIATVGVPEPATWAMMIMGSGLLGGTLRRRNRALATVGA